MVLLLPIVWHIRQRSQRKVRSRAFKTSEISETSQKEAEYSEDSAVDSQKEDSEEDSEDSASDFIGEAALQDGTGAAQYSGLCLGGPMVGTLHPVIPSNRVSGIGWTEMGP